jgi:signal peptidase
VGVTTTTGGAVAYITKGDANNAPDADPRPAKDVVGVFQRAIPRGGYILNALHQPLVLGLLLAAPVLWFIAGPLFEMARKMDEPAVDAGKAEAEAP